MICWGSWANTLKLCPDYRFQLFYWDYVIGLILAALVWGFTLGSIGGVGRSFVADLLAADSSHVTLAVTGGILFNIANVLLVAAIEIAGLAVAFPVGIGLALVVGAISNYIISPGGNALMLFGGIATGLLGLAVLFALSTPAGRRGVVVSIVGVWPVLAMLEPKMRSASVDEFTSM